MIRVFITDDHEIFINGLMLAFMNIFDIRITGKAGNGKEALEKLKSVETDVILLDINMPEMNGLDCAKHLAKEHPHIRIIMLSQYGETRLMKRLEKFNIAGYLLKDTPTDEIAEAIRTVMTGTKYFGRSLNLSSGPSKVNEFGFFDDKLSTREQEVLECICDELNNQEIANFLEISVHTVETIRFRLMNKTGAKNTAGLVKWAFHQGILGGNPNPPL